MKRDRYGPNIILVRVQTSDPHMGWIFETSNTIDISAPNSRFDSAMDSLVVEMRDRLFQELDSTLRISGSVATAYFASAHHPVHATSLELRPRRQRDPDGGAIDRPQRQAIYKVRTPSYDFPLSSVPLIRLMEV